MTLRAKRIRRIVYCFVLMGLLMMLDLLKGDFQFSDLADRSFIMTLLIVIGVSQLLPIRVNDLILTDSTLTGPMVHGLFIKATTVSLSEVHIGKSRLNFLSCYICLKDNRKIPLNNVDHSMADLKKFMRELQERAQTFGG